MNASQLRSLGFEAAIRLTAAPKDKTFYYCESRGGNLRVINYEVINKRRFQDVRGPLIYAFTNHADEICYVGKWDTGTPLRSRMIRHDHIHHQKTARNKVIARFDQGEGPFCVWSANHLEGDHEPPRLGSTFRESPLFTRGRPFGFGELASRFE